MSTYQELLAQQTALAKQTAELDRQLQEARRAERTGVLAQIKQLMSMHGLTPEDLGTMGKEKKSGSAGKTVAPKYRDVASGKTWTGRGLQPKWLKDALALGKSLDDLRI